jgi:hypothetical protein
MLNNKSEKASARITEGKLVLSLPDAMTPVVWMISLDNSDGGSFFMRVEKDDNGLHVLQKIEGTGKSIKIEDIAYYMDRKQAVEAMTMVGRVAGNRDSASQSGSDLITTLFSVLKIAVMTFIFIAFLYVLYLLVADRFLGGEAAVTTSPETSSMAPSTPVPMQAPAPPQPTVESNPDAVGVPLSADDYMNDRGGSKGVLPFLGL